MLLALLKTRFIRFQAACGLLPGFFYLVGNGFQIREDIRARGFAAVGVWRRFVCLDGNGGAAHQRGIHGVVAVLPVPNADVPISGTQFFGIVLRGEVIAVVIQHGVACLNQIQHAGGAGVFIALGGGFAVAVSAVVGDFHAVVQQGEAGGENGIVPHAHGAVFAFKV